MSLRLRCFALMLVLCLGLSGCSPTAETQSAEQNNRHFRAGKEKLAALDYKGAVESFERSLEDNPRSALAHFELGVLFEQHENDYAAALYHYNKALKLRPNDYPAENIRLRVPACKQELVKADSLAVINPGALRETERLRDENTGLRRHIALLQGQLASRPPAGPPVGSSGGLRAGARESSYSSAAASPSRTNPPVRGDLGTAGRGVVAGASDPARSGTLTPGRMRTHAVKPGETAFSIARQYQTRTDSLLSANPGLDPKRLRVGQVLNIPAS